MGLTVGVFYRGGSPGDPPPPCMLKRYSNLGDKISEMVIKLPRFPNDRAWRDTHPFGVFGDLRLKGVNADEDIVGMVWNRSLQTNWKTTLFYFVKYKGALCDSRVLLTIDWTCLDSKCCSIQSPSMCSSRVRLLSRKLLSLLSFHSAKRGRLGIPQ